MLSNATSDSQIISRNDVNVIVMWVDINLLNILAYRPPSCRIYFVRATKIFFNLRGYFLISLTHLVGSKNNSLSDLNILLQLGGISCLAIRLQSRLKVDQTVSLGRSGII